MKVVCKAGEGTDEFGDIFTKPYRVGGGRTYIIVLIEDCASGEEWLIS